MELNKNEYILYKGLPLVREGNTICYGDLNEKYMLMLNIISEKENILIKYARIYEKELREPPIDILCKLANFYNVTLDYLVDRVYINDIGYLDNLDRNIIKLSKELNQANKIQALAYISGLFTAQK